MKHLCCKEHLRSCTWQFAARGFGAGVKSKVAHKLKACISIPQPKQSSNLLAALPDNSSPSHSGSSRSGLRQPTTLHYAWLREHS